jgi:hypothetical protein
MGPDGGSLSDELRFTAVNPDPHNFLVIGTENPFGVEYGAIDLDGR